MAYVALSRCRSLEGLELVDLGPNVIRANQGALEYYRHLDEWPATKAGQPGGIVACHISDQWSSNRHNWIQSTWGHCHCQTNRSV